MLKWVLTLAVVSIVAGVFGFGSAAVAAKVLFCVFLVLFVAASLIGLVSVATSDRDRSPWHAAGQQLPPERGPSS